VDDDESMRSLLERGLGQGGFEVFLAKDGPEAVEFYGQQGSGIDLVLLDICMPGLDGPQTLRALRQQHPSVRCCFISVIAVATAKKNCSTWALNTFSGSLFRFRKWQPN
jgi:CheY-like chemotaxis protein